MAANQKLVPGVEPFEIALMGELVELTAHPPIAANASEHEIPDAVNGMSDVVVDENAGEKVGGCSFSRLPVCMIMQIKEKYYT